MIEDLEPEDRVVVKMIALFCASTAMSGTVTHPSTVIKMAQKFEEYLAEEVE